MKGYDIMKTCSRCNTACNDDAAFCTSCGNPFAVNQQQNFNQAGQTVPPTYAPMYNPYDHTAEFDAKDISENKVISMLVYLLGAIGIIIALLAGSSSKYATFHVRQALKFTVVEILGGIIAILLCWTIIVPIIYGIFALVLFVIKFICFIQICSGKAVEPAIIRDFGFLK